MTAPNSALRSIVFQLRAGTTPSAINGRQLHAAFLAWVASNDAALAAELHAPGRPRPFTLTMLPTARPNGPPELRWTLLDDRLCALVERHLGSDPAIRSSRIGLAEYDLAPVVDHPWSGCVLWSALAAAATAEREIRLQFASPTCFSRDLPGERKRLALFPEPAWVWESWARKWSLFGPPVAGLATIGNWAARLVLVSAYRLETCTLDFGRFQERGFVGNVAYVLPPDTPEEIARTLNLLADFAFYAGTGYKTAMGLGLTRRVASADLPSTAE